MHSCLSEATGNGFFSPIIVGNQLCLYWSQIQQVKNFREYHSLISVGLFPVWFRVQHLQFYSNFIFMIKLLYVCSQWKKILRAEQLESYTGCRLQVGVAEVLQMFSVGRCQMLPCAVCSCLCKEGTVETNRIVEPLKTSEMGENTAWEREGNKKEQETE